MKRSDKRDTESQNIQIAQHTVVSKAGEETAAESGGNENQILDSVDKGEAAIEKLCDRMLSALSLVQNNLSEVLDVKDELLLQNLPSSVQSQLSLCISRLFRSLSDLYVPSTELVRLVHLFGPQWEKKRLIMKQLQDEHERLQRLLSLALRRVQILEAQSSRDAQSQTYRNWEKLFVQVMRRGPHKPSPLNNYTSTEQNTDGTMVQL